MNAAPARRLRAGIVVPALFTLAAAATFVALGTWQIERKAWKEDLIAKLNERSSAEAVDLPRSANWSAPNRADDEFRRVKFRAEFLPGAEAFVFTGAAEFRTDARMSGYLVFAPVRTPDGAVVVVNRGFTHERREYQAFGRPSGVIDLVGALRWPEGAGWFVREYDRADDTWIARDHLGMAARNDWGRVAPFYIELESPQPPGGLPRPGPRKIDLRNMHLNYAIIWYGLALVVVVMFAFWLGSGRYADRRM